MADQIEICDLLVRIHIGITAEERSKAQDVVINVILHTDTRAAAASDNIDDAVNYRTLNKQIVALAEASNFNLLETLVHRLACLCLEYRQVERADVRAEKPGALRFARSVALSISRSRDDG